MDEVKSEDIEVVAVSFSEALDVLEVRLCDECDVVSDNVWTDVIFAVEDGSGNVDGMFAPSDEVLKLAGTVGVDEFVLGEEDSIVEVTSYDESIEESAGASVEIMKLSETV